MYVSCRPDLQLAMVKAAVWSCLALALALQAPGANMLVNGDAAGGTGGWIVSGAGKVERIAGVTCFTVRSKGSFQQEVRLPPESIGMYAAVVGKGESDRINEDGSITGLPYLYGMVVAADRTRFLAYWQGQKMLGRPRQPGEWVTMSGIFSVPYGAVSVSIQLRQAERKDSPQNGSAARFSDVRLVLFPTEAAARAYVDEYK
jgi:hypothetical protein